MNPDFFMAVTLVGLFIVGGSYFLGRNGSGGVEPPVPDKGRGTSHRLENLLRSEAVDIGTKKVITLAAASVLWAESPDEIKQDIPRPTFTHDEIDLFYTEMVEHRKTIYGKKEEAIIALLGLLDSEGACPSVVRNPNHPDPDNKYTEEAFVMLAQIPLYEHTLGVARAMSSRVGRDTLIPDAMIVSLGHDIGKIPDYHKRGYSTGDHPFISSLVLNGIKEFAALTNRLDLDQVVRRHHSLNPAHPLTAMLKECDQITRNMELATKMKESVLASKAEAFGLLASELEKAKTATLRRMVKTIKPKNRNGDSSNV